MLQQFLDQNDVPVVVIVNLCGEEFSERMRPDVFEAKIIADLLQILLNRSFRNSEKTLVFTDAVFPCIPIQIVIDFIRYCKGSFLAGLLLRYVKSPAVTVENDIRHPERQNVFYAQAEVCFNG